MLLGRFVFKEWVEKQAEKYPIIKAIDKAIENEGLKLTLLLRLSPLIPFNMFNYLMGITGVKFKDYCIGSCGMIPGTLVYVFIGTSIASIADIASGNTGEDEGNKVLVLVLFIVGSVLACVGIVYVSIVAKRQLDIQLKLVEEEKGKE